MKALASRMDRRIRIEHSAPSDDGFNETEVWATFATVPAQFIPAAGREAREQLGREATLLATFRIRWSTAVSVVAPGRYRLRYPAEDGGQVWDIKSAVELGRRVAIELVAVARAGDAT